MATEKHRGHAHDRDGNCEPVPSEGRTVDQAAWLRLCDEAEKSGGALLAFMSAIRPSDIRELLAALQQSEAALREAEKREQRLKKVMHDVTYGKWKQPEETNAILGKQFLAGMEFGMKTLVGMMEFDVLQLPGKTLDEIHEEIAVRAALTQETAPEEETA